MSQSVLNFKGKKVLVFGLGLLGGGVATTNWLLRQGAQVTVTDLKTEEQLKTSLEKINGQVVLKLGGHSEEDIRSHDVIVCNQDVSINNPYIQLAFKEGKRVETEGTLFFKLFPKRIVGITGTRGKTTTTAWTTVFLQSTLRATTAGNWGDVNPFLEIVDKGKNFDVVVAEIPSFQLEYFYLIDRSPEVAIITNLSPDHLNRHGDMKGYALAKANLFKHQTSDQHLILNRDNEWTEFFISQKPKSHIWQFSRTKLPGNVDGIYYEGSKIFLQEKANAQSILSIGNFVKEKGEHNLENLLASSLAAHLAGIPWEKIQAAVPSLPQVKFRQEIIFKNEKLTIINDTTATSPEGAIAALKRFAGPNTILIAGGTDRQLEFSDWADAVTRYITKGNLILLGGSATDKMMVALKERGFDANTFSVQETLAKAVAAGLAKVRHQEGAVLVFSPGAKSFEKFLNEFDRGEQFNALIKKELGHE